MNNNIQLRQVVKEDCDLIFEWVNDAECRENSINTAMISYEEHLNWFINKLNSKDCIMFLLFVDDQPVGQIRLQLDLPQAMISYSVGARYRGHGYGKLLIQLMEREVMKNEEIKYLRGIVKLQNIKSQNIFKEFGYKGTCYEDYIEYNKRITR